MSWRAAFRTELLSVAATPPTAPETDAQRSELLERTLSTAARVLRFARTELSRAGVVAMHTGTSFQQTLTVGRRFLEVALIMNSAALKLRRESGVVDLLHVEGGLVVDGRRLPTGIAEAYFARHVVDLVRLR